VTFPNGVEEMYTDSSMAMAVGQAICSTPIPNTGSCSTDHCLWPPFQTLGVCSECMDLTDHLQLGCLTEDGLWSAMRNITYPSGQPLNQTANITSCGYFINATTSNPILMSGYSLNNSIQPPTPGEGLWMSTLALVQPMANITYWNGSLLFKEEVDKWPIQDFLLALNPEPVSVYNHQAPMAAECLLRWCVKTIAAEYKDGVFTETVESAYFNESSLPPQFQWRWNPISGGGAHIAYDINISPPGQNETFSVPKLVASQSYIPIETFIPSYFTTANASGEVIYWKFDNLPLNEQIDPVLSTMDYSRWPKPSSAAEYAERIATSMTNVIRNYPNSSIPVSGFGGMISYVKIEWAWLSLPVIISVTVLALLVATIRSGPLRGEGGVWKTSVLPPLLVQGTGNKPERNLSNTSELSAIRAEAKGWSVVFKPETGEFCFHDSSPDR
jgi:hypothetical protein